MNLPVVAGDAELQDPGALPFSEALRDALGAARDYALAEKSDQTRRVYARDFAAFYTWCDSVKAAALPASVATVGAYLAALAERRLKVSTIDRAAAAIAYAHKLRGFEPPTSAEPVRAVLRGIRRRAGSAVTRKAPATDKHVRAMLKRIPDTLIGKRDRALIGIGFAAALRRSEIVALDLTDLERSSGGVFIHIRKSKTDQAGVGHSVAVPRGSRLNVLDALDEWLAAAAITEGAVFRQVSRAGTVGARLTGQSVALIVKRRAAAAKLDPALFSGHSLRAGFVTSALEAGADVLRVMDVTRHESVQTLKGYDRRAKAFKDHAGGRFL